jgi:DNA-directed RNA polymerase subunit omega
MKADLVKAASEVIPNQQILVNMVSRRVRQLCFGYRPLVQVPPGMDAADIALTEIINEKLTFESTFSKDATDAPIVQFPASSSLKIRGTDLLPQPGEAEKTRRGLLQFHAAPDKAGFR